MKRRWSIGVIAAIAIAIAVAVSLGDRSSAPMASLPEARQSTSITVSLDGDGFKLHFTRGSTAITLKI